MHTLPRKKLRIGIIDVVANAPSRGLYSRLILPNLAGIMPQAIGVWCRQEGHDVTYVCFTGPEDVSKELPHRLDLVFIAAFTEAAYTAYAFSGLFRSKGTVTVLGGPHARCFPEDARQYFDYVLGLTDRHTLAEVLDDCSPHRPHGRCLAASQQPKSLPGVRERWDFVEATLRKTVAFKTAPMLGSLGCPYTCSFCIDATTPYEPMDFDDLKDDLRFLLTKFKRPMVCWHDPNFGVRFNDFMDLIEEAVPPGRIGFLAESSLSLLSEPHLKRLQRNGFKALFPGIESWFAMGDKSKTGARKGMDKVRQVSDHMNTILRYIPYVQTNFVLGLDSDEGPEPFELTKRFMDLTPGAYPTCLTLTAYGRATAVNLGYQRDERVLPLPFHLLNNSHMNVRPRNYSWREMWDNLAGLTRHAYSARATARRVGATRGFVSRMMNLARSREGVAIRRRQAEIRHRLHADRQFRRFFEGETAELPRYYVDLVRKELGPLWSLLPEGTLRHDPNAYLRAELGQAAMPGLSAS